MQRREEIGEGFLDEVTLQHAEMLDWKFSGTAGVGFGGGSV